MTSRFVTDPQQMRAMAGRLDVHTQTMEDEARTIWGVVAEHCRWRLERDRSGHLLRHHGQMHQAFRNIVTMLHAVRDGLLRDTNNYEAHEQASQQILTS